MCKIYQQSLTDEIQFATFVSHDVIPSRSDRERMLQALVNGEFLRTNYDASVVHAVCVSISTISALSKQLELDLACQDALVTKSDVDTVAREFGMYVYLPVMQFQSTMRRLLYSTWTPGSSHSLQRLIVKFLKMFEDVDNDSRALLITASHLLFAIYSAKKYDGGKHNMPFSIEINGRGKFYLVYHYVSSKSKRARIIRWDLGLRLPSTPNPLLSQMVSKA